MFVFSVHCWVFFRRLVVFPPYQTTDGLQLNKFSTSKNWVTVSNLTPTADNYFTYHTVLALFLK